MKISPLAYETFMAAWFCLLTAVASLLVAGGMGIGVDGAVGVLIILLAVVAMGFSIAGVFTALSEKETLPVSQRR